MASDCPRFALELAVFRFSLLYVDKEPFSRQSAPYQVEKTARLA